MTHGNRHSNDNMYERIFGNPWTAFPFVISMAFGAWVSIALGAYAAFEFVLTISNRLY